MRFLEHPHRDPASVLMIATLAIVTLAIATLAIACGDQPVETPAACCPAEASDWPQFLGGSRNGVATATGLAATWGESGPPEIWRREIGSGFSGVAAKGGALYSAWSADGEERLYRLDAETGEEVWSFSLGEDFEEVHGNGPRTTPTVDERDVVYAQSSRGRLAALRGDDGSLLWEADLYRRYGGGGYLRGYASSPLIDGDRLVLHVGPRRAIVSLDRDTGEEIWAVGQGRASSSSPIVADVHGSRQIVSTIGFGMLGLDPASGAPRWQVPWPTEHALNIALAVPVGENRFLIGSAYDQGAVLIAIDREGETQSARVVWENRLFRTQFTAAVFYEGFLYGFDNTILKCLDATTGETAWRARGYGRGSLIAADGKLIVLSDDGDVALLEATGEGHRELARATVLDGKTWTSPSLAGTHLYLRSQTELVALDLAAREDA